jgi:hypothetical protein
MASWFTALIDKPAALALTALTPSLVTAGYAVDAVQDARLATLTVERINVVEPDGTLRMVISGKGTFPGAFEQGREIPRADRNTLAGMLFLDDEANEIGGLIYSGSEGKDGIQSGLSLTFDRYKQDQVVQLSSSEGEGVARGGLMILDRPSASFATVYEQMRLIDEARALPREKRGAFVEANPKLQNFGQQRAYLGTDPSGQSTLELRDPSGRVRLRLSVGAKGEPVIELLDEEGRVRRSVTYEETSAGQTP